MRRVANALRKESADLKAGMDRVSDDYAGLVLERNMYDRNLDCSITVGDKRPNCMHRLLVRQVLGVSAFVQFGNSVHTQIVKCCSRIV